MWNDLLAWLEENAFEDDLIPGAVYHHVQQLWEVIDPEALREYIEEGE